MASEADDVGDRSVTVLCRSRPSPTRGQRSEVSQRLWLRSTPLRPFAHATRTVEEATRARRERTPGTQTPPSARLRSPLRSDSTERVAAVLLDLLHAARAEATEPSLS
jgi:hypothetical protein